MQNQVSGISGRILASGYVVLCRQELRSFWISERTKHVNKQQSKLIIIISYAHVVSSYFILVANRYGKITLTNISALFKNDSSISWVSSVITGSVCVTDSFLIFHVRVTHSYWRAIDMPGPPFIACLACSCPTLLRLFQ